MATQFVVFSSHRSGTTLLVNTLDSHPDVLCHGEIFQDEPMYGEQAYLLNVRREYLDRHDYENERARGDLAYARSILECDAGALAVGFKIFFEQSPEVCVALLNDLAIKKIILERENKLAAFASFNLATLTGIWNQFSHRPAAHESVRTIPFSRDEFLRMLEKDEYKFKCYREQAQGACLELTYRELVMSGFDPILAYLGIRCDALNPATARLHDGDILSRFDRACHSEILKVLEEVEHPEWVSERFDVTGPPETGRV